MSAPVWLRSQATDPLAPLVPTVRLSVTMMTAPFTIVTVSLLPGTTPPAHDAPLDHSPFTALDEMAAPKAICDSAPSTIISFIAVYL